MNRDDLILEALAGLGCATASEVYDILPGRTIHKAHLPHRLSQMAKWGLVTELGAELDVYGNETARWRLTA